MSTILNKNTDGTRIVPLGERELMQELTVGSDDYGKIKVGTDGTLAGEVLLAKDEDVVANATAISNRYTKIENDNLLDDKQDIATLETAISPYNKGFKNYIINGGFDVWQRGTSFTGQLSTGAYRTADRINTDGGVADTGTFSQSTDTPDGFKYSWKLDRTGGSDGRISFHISVENGWDKLNSKTVTLSLYAKTTNSQQISDIYVYADSAINIGGIIPTTAWQRFSKTFTLSKTGGGNFICRFDTNYSNKDLYITGIQLEEGSVATPFEQRPYGLELSLCQRYLPYRSYFNNYTNHGTGVANSTTQATIEIPQKTTARTIPTAVTWAGSMILVQNGATFAVTGISIALPVVQSPDRIRILVDVSSGLTANEKVSLQNNNDTTAYIEISTEL